MEIVRFYYMKFVNYEYLRESALRLVSCSKLVKGLANSHAVRTSILSLAMKYLFVFPKVETCVHL